MGRLLTSLAVAGAAAQLCWAQYPGAVPGATPSALPVRLAPSFGMEDVVPEVHKNYVPIHLPEYHRYPWFATDTGYSTQFYKRYLDRQLEGDEWYDSFGNHLEQVVFASLNFQFSTELGKASFLKFGTW